LFFDGAQHARSEKQRGGEETHRAPAIVERLSPLLAVSGVGRWRTRLRGMRGQSLYRLKKPSACPGSAVRRACRGSQAEMVFQDVWAGDLEHWDSFRGEDKGRGGCFRGVAGVVPAAASGDLDSPARPRRRTAGGSAREARWPEGSACEREQGRARERVGTPMLRNCARTTRVTTSSLCGRFWRAVDPALAEGGGVDGPRDQLAADIPVYRDGCIAERPPEGGALWFVSWPVTWG